MVDSELTLAVRLGLSAGLRREEICGLRWRDVDFQRDLILVRNAVTEAAGHSFEKGPKSETSWRDIPLEPDLKARLEAKYKRATSAYLICPIRHNRRADVRMGRSWDWR